MDSLVTLINTAVCCILAAAATWACLSPRVHDGIVIKLGLIGLALGFASHAWIVHDGIDAFDAVGLARAQLMINAGMLAVVVGVMRRARPGRRGHAPERRASDFVDLDADRSERQP
jgi:hypothetical protein